MPMGQHKIVSLMKCIVANSLLSNQSLTKKLTNHSVRKTLVKKLKRNNVPKSEIIGITGHTNVAGLDVYDSGDEREQQMMSHAIDNVQTATTSSGMSATNNNWLVPVQHASLQNPTFKLVDVQKKHHHSILATVQSIFTTLQYQILLIIHLPLPQKALICCVLAGFFARINIYYL